MEFMEYEYVSDFDNDVERQSYDSDDRFDLPEPCLTPNFSRMCEDREWSPKELYDLRSEVRATSLSSIQLIAFAMRPEYAEPVLKILVDDLRYVSNNVTIDSSLVNDAQLIIRVAQAVNDPLLAFGWTHPRYQHDAFTMDVERAIGEHVMMKHGYALEILTLAIDARSFSVSEFAKYFKHLQVLQRIELIIESINPKEYVEICEALADAPCAQTLEEVFIAWPHEQNDDSINVKIAAFTSLLFKLKNLKCLDWPWMFSPGCDKDIIQQLCDVLVELPIRKVHLHGIESICQTSELYRFIETSKTLEELEFIHFKFATNDLKSLCDAFGRSLSLRKVYLECQDPNLQARSMFVNKYLEYVNINRFHPNILQYQRVLNIRGRHEPRPSIDAAVMIIHAGNDVQKSSQAQAMDPTTTVPQKRSVLCHLSMDLVRYLYSFFEDISEMKLMD